MVKSKNRRRTPGVVFHPRTHQGMQRGIEKLVAAIRPTLGPVHGVVAIEKESKVGRPELLDNGAIIARRLIQLPDRDEDAGAMYLRQLLTALHNSVGDGSATAALIFEKVYKKGLAYITSGGSAMRLRQALERAAGVVMKELEAMSFNVEGKEALSQPAESICYDPEIAKLLGEIFDVIGEYGRLDVQIGKGRSLEREYIEGMYWNSAIFSPHMISDPNLGRAQLEDAAILISDLEINDPQSMICILDTAMNANIKSLFLVASAISEQVLALLLTKKNQEKIMVVAAKVPGFSINDQRENLEDLAFLTGGRIILKAAGDSLLTTCRTDFGFARRVWADAQYFGVSGGKGDPRRLRQHIAELRGAFQNCDGGELRQRLQERIGKLLGGSAILWIGDPSPIAAQARLELAKRCSEAMRGAMHSGVLPGGGVALLNCQKKLLDRYHAAQETDERAAYYILASAVEAPIRALLKNAGINPDEILAQIKAAGEGYGYDVLKHKLVHMVTAGIVDSAEVLHQAVYRAIYGAALILTVDILVHRAVPPEVYHTT